MPRWSRSLLLGVLLGLVVFGLAPARAQTPPPIGVPPRVALFTQDGGAREVRVTINNDTTAFQVEHYHADETPMTHPPRHRSGYGPTGYGNLNGRTFVGAHIYGDAQPDDHYYIREAGYGPERLWGPYLVDQENPQPHIVSLPVVSQ